jgi:hypothetical protein
MSAALTNSAIQATKRKALRIIALPRKATDVLMKAVFQVAVYGWPMRRFPAPNSITLLSLQRGKNANFIAKPHADDCGNDMA